METPSNLSDLGELICYRNLDLGISVGVGNDFWTSSKFFRNYAQNIWKYSLTISPTAQISRIIQYYWAYR